MPKITFKLDGLENLLDFLKAARKAIPIAVGGALYQFGEEVMGDSKAQYVPVDTGALMNSGKVMPPIVTDYKATVELGYGDDATPYALYVHEELDSPKGNPIHWSRPGSGPKYLTRPLEAKQNELPARIIDAVAEVLKP